MGAARMSKPAIHGRDHRPGGADPIPNFGDFRLVWGAVLNDAGIIDAGSGDWTIAWEDDDTTSPGLNFYTITFDVAFAGDDPVVLLTGNNDTFTGGDPGAYTATLLRRANDHIVVYTHNIDDPDSLSTQDAGFDFAVIGAA